MAYPEPKDRILSEDEKEQIREEILDDNPSSGHLADKYDCSPSQVAGIKAHLSRNYDLEDVRIVEDREVVMNKIIKEYESFYNSSRHSEEDYKWRNVKNLHEFWSNSKDKSGKEFFDDLRSVMRDSNLIGRGNMNIHRKFKNEPQEASRVIKNLLDEEVEIYDRISEFKSFFEMPNAGGTKVASYFLSSMYPQKYIYFKYTEDREFLEDLNLELEKPFSEYEDRIERYLHFNQKCKQLLEEINIEGKDLWHVQDLIWFYASYWLPDNIKNELDKVEKNAESAYTRLFALKCFFESQDEGEVVREEFDKVVREKAESMDLPGENKNSYIQLRYNVFRNYDPFTVSEDTYAVKEEYKDYVSAMSRYIDYLWDKVNNSANYFLVSHNKRPEQLDEGFLKAPYTENSNEFDKGYQPSHDLSRLKEGDIVLHYKSEEFIGYSQVEKKPEIRTNKGVREFYLEVDIKKFDEPRQLLDVRDVLEEEHSKIDKYYALNSKGGKAEGYLKLLTERGANHIIDYNHESNRNYFWVTAKPSIWDVSTLNNGDTKFYPAYVTSGNKARIFRSFEEASKGDKVIFYQSAPVKKVAAEGVVAQGLHKEEAEGYDKPVEGVTLEYKRPVKDDITWTQLNEIPNLEESTPIRNRAQGSIFKLDKDEFETILSLETPGPDPGTEKLSSYINKLEFEIEVPEELYFEKERELEAEINASLNSGKNIIFTGPPGTGKTKLAKHVSQKVSSNKKEVEGSIFTTATADWTAFDTIGGYMPSNGDSLEFKPGQFLKCFREENGKITNKWLVIDEINRSDIDKAFGQLFSVLSGDSVELPYERDGNIRIESIDKDQDLEEIAENKDVYPVTSSWRLIATMNTLDKASLYEMSYAFMRRFNFIHVGLPELENDGEIDPDVVENYTNTWNLEVNDQDKKSVAVLWYKVNKYREIGPSIIKDIFQYMENYNHENALESAIVSLIYPQLEGMRPQKQREFIESLSKTKDLKNGESFSLDLETDSLKQKAEDMFNTSFQKDE